MRSSIALLLGLALAAVGVAAFGPAGISAYMTLGTVALALAVVLAVADRFRAFQILGAVAAIGLGVAIIGDRNLLLPET